MANLFRTSYNKVYQNHASFYGRYVGLPFIRTHYWILIMFTTFKLYKVAKIGNIHVSWKTLQLRGSKYPQVYVNQ